MAKTPSSGGLKRWAEGDTFEAKYAWDNVPSPDG